MKVTIVPVASAIGPGRASSAGGGRQVDRAVRVLRADEAELPVGATGRRPRPTAGPARAGGAARRAASPARRGTCRRRSARRRPTWSATGRRRTRRRPARRWCGTARRRRRRPARRGRRPGPGVAGLERGGQQQAGLGGAGVADGGGRGRRRTAVAERPSFLPRAAAARAWEAATTTRSTWSAVETGGLQGVGPGGDAEGDVADLAEALLPLLRADVAGRAPAVEELLGGAPRRRGTSASSGRRRRCRRAARRRRRRRSPRRRCRAGRCGGRRRPRRRRLAGRPSAAPQGADAPSGPRRRRRRPGRRPAGAGRRGRRWRWSCRGRRGATVENHSERRARRRGAPQSAARAAATPIVVVSSS